MILGIFSIAHHAFFIGYLGKGGWNKILAFIEDPVKDSPSRLKKLKQKGKSYFSDTDYMFPEEWL